MRTPKQRKTSFPDSNPEFDSNTADHMKTTIKRHKNNFRDSNIDFSDSFSKLQPEI